MCICANLTCSTASYLWIPDSQDEAVITQCIRQSTRLQRSGWGHSFKRQAHVRAVWLPLAMYTPLCPPAIGPGMIAKRGAEGLVPDRVASYGLQWTTTVLHVSVSNWAVMTVVVNVWSSCG